MIDFSAYVGKEVELFCSRHGGRDSVVQLGDRHFIFPDGALFYLDRGMEGTSWPQMEEPPSDPIVRQERIVQHHKAMFDFHYGQVQDRLLMYRSLYKKERLLGTNREPVTYFFDAGQPPPVDAFVAETERLFALASDWKSKWQLAVNKLEQLRNPPKSQAEVRREARQQWVERERQDKLDHRMGRLKL